MVEAVVDEGGVRITQSRLQFLQGHLTGHTHSLVPSHRFKHVVTSALDTKVGIEVTEPSEGETTSVISLEV